MLTLSHNSYLFSQNAPNPFELIPRLEHPINEAVDQQQIPAKTGNPFDIIRGATPVKQSKTTKKKQAKIFKPKKEKDHSPKSKETSYRQFLFISSLTLLIVLTLVFTIFRNVIAISYRAFWNNNILNQLYREQKAIISFPFQVLYCLFFITSGFFLFLFGNYFGITIAEGNLTTLGIYTLCIASIYIIKHLLLKVIGGIFPIDKETGNYSFTIVIFNIVLGIALVPFLILIAFGPQDYIIYLIYAAFGLIVFTFLFRCLRGIFIANHFIAFHKFHFLLYICAVEIAPFLILLKVLLLKGDGLGISLFE